MDIKKEAKERFDTWFNSASTDDITRLLEHTIFDAYNQGVMDAVKVVKGQPYESNVALPKRQLVLESLFRLILGTASR
jgi:hypothetical protein